MTTDGAEDRLIELVSSEYDLGAVRACFSIATDPLSNAYKLETDSRSYCLKRQRDEKTAPRLILEETLINRLRNTGFSLAPHLVPTRQGAYHFRTERACWALYDFVASDPPFDWKDPLWTEEHCRQAGHSLAELHFFGQACLEELSGEPGADQLLCSVLPSTGSHLAAGLNLGVPASRPLPVRASCPSADWQTNEQMVLTLEPERLLAGAKAVCSQITAAEARLNDNSFLVHGDYHPGNLLFRDSKPVCMLDYEYIHKDSPAFDLGYATLFFCARWTKPEVMKQGKEEAFDLKSFEALMTGYRQSAKRLALESKLLPFLESSQSAFTFLLPYIKLSCYLTISWLLQRFPLEPENNRPVLISALIHVKQALSAALFIERS